jgi:hypothetical protein
MPSSTPFMLDDPLFNAKYNTSCWMIRYLMPSSTLFMLDDRLFNAKLNTFYVG